MRASFRATACAALSVLGCQQGFLDDVGFGIAGVDSGSSLSPFCEEAVLDGSRADVPVGPGATPWLRLDRWVAVETVWEEWPLRPTTTPRFTLSDASDSLLLRVEPDPRHATDGATLRAEWPADAQVRDPDDPSIVLGDIVYCAEGATFTPGWTLPSRPQPPEAVTGAVWLADGRTSPDVELLLRLVDAGAPGGRALLLELDEGPTLRWSVLRRTPGLPRDACVPPVTLPLRAEGTHLLASVERVELPGSPTGLTLLDVDLDLEQDAADGRVFLHRLLVRVDLAASGVTAASPCDGVVRQAGHTCEPCPDSDAESCVSLDLAGAILSAPPSRDPEAVSVCVP